MTRGVSKGIWLGSYPRDSGSTPDPATMMGLSLAGESNRLINDRGWVRLPKSLHVPLRLCFMRTNKG